MQLSDKYPFLTNYFETAIKNKRNNTGIPITHSILFYGEDIQSQYILSKEIARLLNCNGDLSNDCQCLNCKWINENTHPAVLTISRFDNKPSGDDSKTVISIKQAEMVKNLITTTSEFYRVFIFCDKDENGNIQGLNQLNFQDKAANSMLKMIEEPNDRILFIFITRNKEDMLSTIVSRSQCFNLSAPQNNDLGFTDIIDIYQNYWEIERKEIFNISNKLNNLFKTNEPEKLLVELQNYVLHILKTNPSLTTLINDFKYIEQAKKELNLGMNQIQVIENLNLKLIK